LGRRNVGGSAEDDIRVSRMDLLIALLNISRREIVVLVIQYSLSICTRMLFNFEL
jgi:hypothetical protein